MLLTHSRDICQIVNIRNMAIKRHTLLPRHWDICYYVKQGTYQILLHKSEHIIYPDTGTHAKQ